MGVIVLRGSFNHVYMRLSQISEVVKNREVLGWRSLQHDEDWMFITERDKIVCEECRSKEHTIHRGDYIPARFPFHELIDFRHITAKVHNHCRCILEWLDSFETITVRLHTEIRMVI